MLNPINHHHKNYVHSSITDKLQYLELMEPKGVDKEYKILNDVAKYGNYKERLSPVGVREGPRKQSENNRW